MNTTKKNIFAAYSSWINKQSDFAPDWEEIRKYERKSLTEKLSMVFDKAVERINR